jgi:excisionase family DNA binding protein
VAQRERTCRSYPQHASIHDLRAIIEGMNASVDPQSIGRFLTLAEVSEILNVTMDVATGLVQSGELPAIRIGGVGEWRVERTMLEQYIDDQYEYQRRVAALRQGEFADTGDFLEANATQDDTTPRLRPLP